MRRLSPAFSTLPSRMLFTFSFAAMVLISKPLPLKANEDVRAVTLSWGFFSRTLMSSSESPSEKYSWFGFSPMFSKGSTAIVLILFVAFALFDEGMKR